MMNLFDLAIISILCFCLIRGVFTGLIRELFSLTGVLIGFIAASTFYMAIAKFLSRWTLDASKIKILSFLCIIFGSLITIGIFGRIAKQLFKIDLLSGVDNLFGAGVATVKAVLIVSVLLLTLTAFLPGETSSIKNSLLSAHFTVVSEKMAMMVSKDMRHGFQTKIGAYKKAWKNKK
jgi:membrane protein required for colicin V production